MRKLWLLLPFATFWVMSSIYMSTLIPLGWWTPGCAMTTIVSIWAAVWYGVKRAGLLWGEDQ